MAGKKSKAGYDGKIAGLYDLEDTIGRGHFAVVKLARHVFTGEKVAVKVIDKTKLDEVSRAHLFQEVRCMKLVQHPNVVRLYQVIDTQTKLYLILELGDGGDMYDYIMKHDGGLDENLARRYFRQIVEAISYCHKLHVVHRDLKPENVVFFEQLEIVKLTDFGFSNMFNPGKKLETSCGSLAYSAPEILLGDSYDAPAVDVWSLGVILFMLVVGQPPFQEANDSETLTMIMDCKYKVPDYVSAQCKELISKMLVRDPSQRYTLEEILGHSWLQHGDHLPPSNMPLISRELISEADHAGIVDKMVEGNIASREEILKSLERDSYDHLTATYFLLMEKRLRRHQQLEMEMKQAAAGHARKQSIPVNQPGKPHLEPLSLSPRVHKFSPHHPELQSISSLDDATLKRKSQDSTDTGSEDAAHRNSLLGDVNIDGPSAAIGRPNQDVIVHEEETVVSDENAVPNLSDEANSSSPGVQLQGGPGKDIAKSYVQSLVSPPGTHPSPSTSPKHLSSPLEKRLSLRKCSLIREESVDVDEEAEEMEVDALNPIQILESSDDLQHMNTSHSCHIIVSQDSPGGSVGTRRQLKSVSSSPQLLNQIYEENESDEEDDFVPQKLLSPGRMPASMASPEILRKFEQRKKRRGAGQRGTSCSSSDASDTDDTEGRSRKDKLKHKFVHRRDSSDHSSDTDGPGDHGGGLGGGPPFGQGGGGGSRGDQDRGGERDRNRDSNKRDGSGKGSKHQSSSQHRGGSGGKQHGKMNLDLNVLGRKLNQLSAASLSSSANKDPASSKMVLSQFAKGVGRQWGWSAASARYLSSSDCELVSDLRSGLELRKIIDITGLCRGIGEKNNCSVDCPSLGVSQKARVKISTDINSNGFTPFCKSSAADQLMNVESKCCSVV